jgi:hypothetical protein
VRLKHVLSQEEMSTFLKELKLLGIRYRTYNDNIYLPNDYWYQCVLSMYPVYWLCAPERWVVYDDVELDI